MGSDFTACGWIYTAGLGSGYGYAFTILGGSGQGFYLDFGTGNWQMFIEDENGGAWPGASIGTLSANTWYHVALTKTSSALQGFFRALASTTYTSGDRGAPQSWSTVTSFTIGGDERYGSTSNYRQLRLYGWKLYQQALSTDELYLESLRALPWRYTNSWDVYPFLNNSGQGILNAYTLTTGGTTVQDNPAVSWGAPVLSVGQAVGTAPITINAAAGVLTVTGQQATVAVPLTVQASAGTITATGQQANLNVQVKVAAGVGMVTATGQQATIEAIANVKVPGLLRIVRANDMALRGFRLV